MRKYEVKETQQIVKKKTVEITCDLCGVNGYAHIHNVGIIGDHRTECVVEWKHDEDHYTDVTTTIALERATNYSGEDGSNEYLFFDVCPECFKQELIPFLKSKGAEPQKANYYW